MSLTPEQIEARKKTIGGSDMGAILGENNYKTAYEIWEEKVEGKTVDLSRNKSVVIGNLLESSLLKKYERDCDKICIVPGEEEICPKTYYHKEYKFLSANLDGISILANTFNDERIAVSEIKTAASFNKDEWGISGSQKVPKQYYAQIAHYMLVTGYEQADIFVGFVDDKVVGEILCEIVNKENLIEPLDFSEIVDKMETRLYTFYKDEEMEQLILEAGVSFYENHMRPWIEHGIKNPPTMDFSNKSFQDCLKRKYSIVEESEIRLPSEYLEVKNNYVSALIQSKKYDKIAQEKKAKIVEAMGNNHKAFLSDGSYFSRKTIQKKAFEVKASEYIKFEFKDKKGEF